MARQMSFFEPDAGSSARSTAGPNGADTEHQPSNLFFALAPPTELAERIERQAHDWDRQQELGGKLLRADLLHVSLHAIGFYTKGVPPEVVEFALRIGDTLSARVFDLVFDRAMSFRGSKSPYVLRVGEGSDCVKGFWKLLGMAIANAGGNSRETSFTPHMTLSYGGRIVPEQRITPIPWHVTDLVLISSLYGKSRHQVLGRWPLQD